MARSVFSKICLCSVFSSQSMTWILLNQSNWLLMLLLSVPSTIIHSASISLQFWAISSNTLFAHWLPHNTKICFLCVFQKWFSSLSSPEIFRGLPCWPPPSSLKAGSTNIAPSYPLIEQRGVHQHSRKHASFIVKPPKDECLNQCGTWPALSSEFVVSRCLSPVSLQQVVSLYSVGTLPWGWAAALWAPFLHSELQDTCLFQIHIPVNFPNHT